MGNSISGATIDRIDKPDWTQVRVQSPLYLCKEKDGIIFSGKYFVFCGPTRGSPEQNYMKLTQELSQEQAQAAFNALLPYLLLPSITRPQLKRIYDIVRDYQIDMPVVCALAYAGYADLLQEASSRFPVDVVDKEGNSPLHLALNTTGRAVSMPCVEVLLASPRAQFLLRMANRTEKTALHVAAASGAAHAATRIAHAGANLEARDREGFTPFLTAVREGQAATMSVLLQCGADYSVRVAGMAAIHVAAKYDSADCLERLLELMPVNAVADNGDMPLHIAARHNSRAVAKCLLRRGAAAIAVNREGETALHIAAHKKHDDIAIAILNHDPNAVIAMDSKGRTAVHRAVESKDATFLRAVCRCDNHVILALDLTSGSPSLLEAARADDSCMRWLLEIRNRQLTHIVDSMRGQLEGAGIVPIVTAGLAALAARLIPAQPDAEAPVDDHEKVAIQRELENLKTTLTCSVCLANAVEVALVPCGHVCSCRECAAPLHTCPVCRSPIQSRLRIYVNTQ